MCREIARYEELFRKQQLQQRASRQAVSNQQEQAQRFENNRRLDPEFENEMDIDENNTVEDGNYREGSESPVRASGQDANEEMLDETEQDLHYA